MRRVLQSAQRGRWVGIVACGAMIGVACTGSSPPVPNARAPESPAVANGPAIRYHLRALTGQVLSDDRNLGRNTVIAFLATYDLPSQAQARFLNAVATRHRPITNCFAVFVETRENEVLVESYAQALGLRYPLVLLEPGEMRNTDFSAVHAIPMVLVLDSGSRAVWSRLGPVPDTQIEAVLRTLE